jgi:hypothetical protein
MPFVFRLSMGILFGGGSVATIYNTTDNPIYAEAVIASVVLVLVVAAVRRFYRINDEQSSRASREPD